MRKQAFLSTSDKKNKSNNPFFSPAKRLTDIESTFFQKKSEQSIPSIDCGSTSTRRDANFDNVKIADGIMAKSDTKVGKFVTVKQLYMDTFKIIFEKSAEWHGIEMKLSLQNGTIAKEFIQTNDKVELKLNIPSTGLSWELLFTEPCYALRIGFGVSS